MILCFVSDVLAANPGFQDPWDRRPYPRERIETPVTLEPTYTFSSPESAVGHAVLFHPDGARAYGLFHAETLDMWKLAVNYWPEAGGVVVGLIGLPLVMLAVRALRRPQRANQLYCRRCNYNLAGLPALSTLGKGPPKEPEARCPECGVDLNRRRPVRGIPTWKRAAIPLCVSIALVAGYASLWAFHLPRSGTATTWVNWTSKWWYDQAQQRQWTDLLKKYRTRGDLIIEYDLATGRTNRTLYRSSLATSFPPLLTPDGLMMIVSGPVQGSLARISTETGRRLGWIQVAPPASDWDPFAPPVIGFNGRGDQAYLNVADHPSSLSRLLAWDLRRDEATQVLTAELYKDEFGPRSGAYKRRFAVLPASNVPRFLSMPGFMETSYTRDFTLKIHTPGEEDRSIKGRADIDPMAPPIVTPDGRFAFFKCDLYCIAGYDLTSGESAGVLKLSYGDYPSENLAVSPDGRLLAVPCRPNCFLLRDLTRQLWLARLEHAKDPFQQRPVFSPNGRWLGASFQQSFNGRPNVPPGGVYPFGIVVFDLAPVIKALDEPEAPPK